MAYFDNSMAARHSVDFTTHRLLIGTHTSSGAQNYIQIAHVQLPKATAPTIQEYDADREELGSYGAAPIGKSSEIKFNIVQKIDHPGEVNKARYMPQNADVFATMCTNAKVMIWDRTKHSSVPTGVVTPQIELLGHEMEGFGLSWSPFTEGQLATGSEDHTVRLWDIQGFSKSSKTLAPTNIFAHHTAFVNDVQHHPHHSFLIGTVSDDLTLQLLDLRSSKADKSAVKTNGHDDAINAIAFNPATEFLFATASADKTIALWDLRNMRVKLHTLEGHQDAVTSLSWNPDEDSILASSSYDRRIIFWDVSKVGDEQSTEDAEDGPPEMLFMHGGHTNRISDFGWNQNDPWVMCSAAEDNLIQVWKISSTIINKDGSDVPAEEMDQ
ncbi:MAG: retinoblastoma binding protein [Trizodia sp. TS-e1964]|nr:MAG: retinoblastoma binding protein [Trizodia sp. TS-e1964]